jgi:hypothetical protein
MNAKPPPAPSGANSPQTWNRPKPETLPKPTIWPPAIALAITFLLWGLVSSLIITVVGLALFLIALAGWVADIRHERKNS